MGRRKINGSVLSVQRYSNRKGLQGEYGTNAISTLNLKKINTCQQKLKLPTFNSQYLK